MAEGDGCADPTNIGECLFIFIGICFVLGLLLTGLGTLVWKVVA